MRGDLVSRERTLFGARRMVCECQCVCVCVCVCVYVCMCMSECELRTVEHLLDFVDERTTSLALTVVKRAFVRAQQAIVDLIIHSTKLLARTR
jgi:hypothetical protein